MKDLFHGTTSDFTEINLEEGKGYKDFGKGFYATAVKSMQKVLQKGINTDRKSERQGLGRKIQGLRLKYIRHFDIIWNLMTVAWIIRES